MKLQKNDQFPDELENIPIPVLGSDIPSLTPASMVRQSRSLQSLLHHSVSASKMCSDTHCRQSGAASTARPRVVGNGLRLVVINDTYRKCKLLSYIGHDTTILCEGQILQASFQVLVRFSQKKLNTSCLNVFQRKHHPSCPSRLDPLYPGLQAIKKLLFNSLLTNSRHCTGQNNDLVISGK